MVGSPRSGGTRSCYLTLVLPSCWRLLDGVRRRRRIGNVSQRPADSLHPRRSDGAAGAGDADTAFTAGIQFARALVGAEPAAFVMALEEQQCLIRCAVLRAGYLDRKARTASEAFEVGALLEWRWITSPERAMARRTA